MGRFINWYLGKLHMAAQRDASLSLAFLRVVNMMALPPSLLNPRMALRVLRGNLRFGAVRAPATSTATPVPLQGA